MKLYIKIYKKTDFDLFLWILGLKARKIRPTTIVRQILRDAVLGEETELDDSHINVPLVSASPELKRIDIFIEYKSGDPVEQVLLNIVDHKRNEFTKNLIRYQVGWVLSRFYLYGAKSWRKDTAQTTKLAEKLEIPEKNNDKLPKASKKNSIGRKSSKKNDKKSVQNHIAVIVPDIKENIADPDILKTVSHNETEQIDDDIGNLFDDLMKDFNY